MSFIIFIAYCVIAFGSHFFMYKRINKNNTEVMTRLNILYGVLAFASSHFFRIILSGLLFVPQRPVIDPTTGELDVVLAAIHFFLSFIDVWAMIITLKKVATGSIRDRAANLGLGWAIFDTFAMRVPTLWRASRSIDWSFDPVLMAMGSTATLFTVMGVVRMAGKSTGGRGPVQVPKVKAMALMMVGLAAPGLVAALAEAFVTEFKGAVTLGAEVVIAFAIHKLSSK